MSQDNSERAVNAVVNLAAPRAVLTANERAKLQGLIEANLKGETMQATLTMHPVRDTRWLFAAAAAFLAALGITLVLSWQPWNSGGHNFTGGTNTGGANVDNKEEKKEGAKREVPKNTVVGLKKQTGPGFNFGNFYPGPGKPVTANVAQYTLPLDTAKIANAKQKRVERLLKNEGAAELLKANGFVVGERTSEDDFTEMYEVLCDEEVPVVVTPDVVLHLFHIVFDEALKDLEEQMFAWDMLDMAGELLASQTRQYEEAKASVNTAGMNVIEAGRQHRRHDALKGNVAYLSVAYKLLAEMPRERKVEQDKDRRWVSRLVEVPMPAVKVHADIADLVEKEMKLIDAHEKSDASPIFGYKENYSQYLPRGHYTRSELLKRYFKAMMWFGRMSFLFHEIPRDGELVQADPPVTHEMAERMTLQAALVAHDLMTLEARPTTRPANAVAVEKVKSLADFWKRVYSCTEFFVGAADDLSPVEFKSALGADKPEKLFDVEPLRKFRDGLAAMPLPRILGGTAGVGVLIDSGEEGFQAARVAMQGMRLMGQRFVPDSEAMSRLVFPVVGRPTTATKENFTYVETNWGPVRAFPRGLDVMTLLGSGRAREILHELKDDGYQGYDKSLDELKKQWDALPDKDWNQNLYYGWLYALKPLLAPASGRTGYPTYMQNKAYDDRMLTAALASWSQLRHDTILYAKQSETPPTAGADFNDPRIVGFVEPHVEFYERMQRLCVMMKEGLKDLGALPKSAGERLERLSAMSSTLADISRRELEGKELAQKDYEYIKYFANWVKQALAQDFGKIEKEGLRTDIIADVHTDGNSKQCLEVGTGKLRLVAITFLNPDGKLLVGFGPVLSFYEFRHPMNDRLTDEAWQKMLAEGKAPADPQWVKNFTSK
ncbi:MAG: DUF3160 domain-containing protein [Planctomycetes bacterium]|nr:DUF3160 domain-containing protein [Planctomycetota bacterium]